MEVLSKIRVVLIEPSHPGNVGAAARALKTMGLSRLVLMAPKHYPHAQETARASGASDILAQTRVCDSWEAALAGTTLVVGTSARSRSLPGPQLAPRACVTRALAEAHAGGQAALVFGRERSGLTNAELERCHYLSSIPANPGYSSLNLAAAVQVFAYELRMAAGAPSTESLREPRAATLELERLYEHLERTLVRLDFLDPDNPRHLMRRLRHLLNRADLSHNEVNILRGILSATDKGTRID